MIALGQKYIQKEFHKLYNVVLSKGSKKLQKKSRFQFISQNENMINGSIPNQNRVDQRLISFQENISIMGVCDQFCNWETDSDEVEGMSTAMG